MQEINDLKNIVIQSLESKGILSQLRAQIRSSVFKVIEDQETKDSKSPAFFWENPLSQKIHESQEGLIALELMHEFFEFYRMDYTNNVFIHESNYKENFSRDQQRENLGVNENDDSKPVMMLIQQKLLSGGMSKMLGASPAMNNEESPQKEESVDSAHQNQPNQNSMNTAHEQDIPPQNLKKKNQQKVLSVEPADLKKKEIEESELKRLEKEESEKNRLAQEKAESDRMKKEQDDKDKKHKEKEQAELLLQNQQDAMGKNQKDKRKADYLLNEKQVDHEEDIFDDDFADLDDSDPNINQIQIPQENPKKEEKNKLADLDVYIESADDMNMNTQMQQQQKDAELEQQRQLEMDLQQEGQQSGEEDYGEEFDDDEMNIEEDIHNPDEENEDDQQQMMMRQEQEGQEGYMEYDQNELVSSDEMYMSESLGVNFSVNSLALEEFDYVEEVEEPDEMEECDYDYYQDQDQDENENELG